MAKAAVSVLLVCSNAEVAAGAREVFAREADAIELECVGSVAKARERCEDSLPALIVAQWQLPDGVAVDLLSGSLKIPLIAMLDRAEQIAEVSPRSAEVAAWLPAEPRFLAQLPALVRCQLESEPSAEADLAAREGGWLERADLRSISDIMGIGAAVISPDFRILETNQYFRSVFGEAVGKPCYQVCRQRDTVCPGCRVQHIFAGGCERISHEQHGINAKGEDVWSRHIAVPLYDGSDEPVAALELVIPVTDLKLAEETLRHRLSYEQMLGEIATLAFRNEDIDAFQQKALRLVGTTMDVSRTYIFEHHEASGTMDNTHEWAAVGISPQRENLQGLPASATPWWMEQMRAGRVICCGTVEDIPGAGERELLRDQGIESVLVIPLHVNHEYYGFLGLDECRAPREWLPEDVHILQAVGRMLSGLIERQRARQALLESERRFRVLSKEFNGLLDAIPDTLTLLSPQFEVLWANRGAALGAGVEPADLLGQHCYRVWHQRAEPCEVCPVARSFATGESHQDTVYTPNGGVWELRAVPITDDEGNLTSVVELAREITASRRSEEERERLIRDLEEKSREVEEFAYTVSHDLKTPLTTIRGFLGLLQRELQGSANERPASFLASIGQAAVRMQQMLDELLELSRAGCVDLNLQTVDMAGLAREAASVASGLLREQGVEVDIAADLPPARGDRLRLRQVWENLISNAARFMSDEPHPRVEIGARHGAEGAVYYVRDNGVGIAPEHQSRVFELFEMLEPVAGGTGFGLAIVKRIVERHGGRVWVESEGLGRGSTFCFTLAPGLPANEGMG